MALHSTRNGENVIALLLASAIQLTLWNPVTPSVPATITNNVITWCAEPDSTYYLLRSTNLVEWYECGRTDTFDHHEGEISLQLEAPTNGAVFYKLCRVP